MDRLNVTVLTATLATRALFDGRRASGIEFYLDGKPVRVNATHEAIVSYLTYSDMLGRRAWPTHAAGPV